MRIARSLGFLVVAMLASASVQAQVYYPETATLKNGMQIVVIPNHRAPVVTNMIWFKTGAIDDPWGSSGIAHFLEHLMFKGTKTHPEGDYSKIISQWGGEENAFTTYDYTAYYATVGKEHLPELMALEADRLAHWQITQDQVDHERDVILKERQQRTENDPVAHFFEDVDAVLYPNYPYQRPTIGWRNEMEKLSKADAEAFYAAHYAPNNAILVVSGDVTMDEVKALAEKNYGPIPAREIAQRRLGQPAQLESKLSLENASPLVKETIWSRHRLVAPARPETIAQSDALLVLDKIFGDDRIGRLYRRLVVKDKIATSASTTYNGTSYGPTRFAVVVTPAPKTDLKLVEKTIDEEIQLLLTKGVSAEEVKQATQALETEAIYARDSVTGPAMAVGGALASGMDIKTIEAWPQRMRNVTQAGVNQAAKELFAKDVSWVTAVLRPEAKK